MNDPRHDFSEEIAVQDQAAVAYQSLRYLKPHSRNYHLWWTRLMLEEVPLDGRILDNGCGTGILLDLLKGRDVVGVDLSMKMLSAAFEITHRVIRGNSLELPFPDRSFDLVLSRSLIHHLPDKEKGITEIARVLKPAGQAVFVDTNRSILSDLPRRIANRGEHFSESHQNLSRKVFERLLETDFEIERIEYFGYLAYPLAFPDLYDFSRIVPKIEAVTRFLTVVDGIISRVPLVRTQSWGILVRARRSVI
ncbi:MAG: methyltransferase domain-containing protein [Candidatus Omnitrophica bacterium]|nr:methyltransferase domain-containing protein [Candidatus Omnitrophota bacterium]